MISVILTHSDVLGKSGQPITTAVTTMDLHDIARSCATYGVSRFYVVHPHDAMHELMEEIVLHWTRGVGGQSNADRKEAMNILQPVRSMDEALKDIEYRTGQKPFLVATSARKHSKSLAIADLKKKVYKVQPLCIIFGSGWGLTPEIIDQCDAVAEPIQPDAPYNHLSVRAAAAILLDRFFGYGVK